MASAVAAAALRGRPLRRLPSSAARGPSQSELQGRRSLLLQSCLEYIYSLPLAPQRGFASSATSTAPVGTHLSPLAVSPLEIARLPRLTFGGRIIVLTSPEDESRVASLFDGEALLGFDSESRPSSALSPKNRVSLVQLATEHVACIWRVGSMGVVPPLLRRLLEDSKVHKVAQGATHEVSVMRQEWGVNAQSFIDLHHMALQLRTSPRSLQGLVALFMQKQLNKELRLTDWEQIPLTQAQIEYAAVDAWAARQVLVAMRRSFMVERLECEKLLGAAAGTPQLDHLRDGQRFGPSFFGALGSTPSATLSEQSQGSTIETKQPSLASSAPSPELHQALASFCIARGYVLRFGGFESAPGGFRCVFSVEYRLRGHPVTAVFRSKRAHSAIRAAQNDAAEEALEQLQRLTVTGDSK